jgi:hypothetical protein
MRAGVTCLDMDLSLGDVLHLLDARIGSAADVTPWQPGVLRVCAYEHRASSRADITDLRVLLVADLLARTAELSGLQVFTALIRAGRAASGTAGESDAKALGCHPSPVYASRRLACSQLGGPVDVHVVGPHSEPDLGPDGMILPVGAAAYIGADRGGAAEAGLLASGQRGDPLAVRAVLMSSACQRTASLTQASLTRATGMLRRWRHQIAEWAEWPSRPIPARVMDPLRAAFNGLDTARALALLHDLTADATLPPGAAFETFIHADRVLGLELEREIGRPRGSRPPEADWPGE